MNDGEGEYNTGFITGSDLVRRKGRRSFNALLHSMPLFLQGKRMKKKGKNRGRITHNKEKKNGEGERMWGENDRKNQDQKKKKNDYKYIYFFLRLVVMNLLK